MAGVLNRLGTAAPVVVVVLLGGTWIALHAPAGRGQVHTLFQVLALTENAIALLLRHRKPVGALAGILVVYVLVDLDPITILPVLLALLTVARLRGPRTTAVAGLVTAAAVAAMPYLHGDRVSPLAGPVAHLLAVGLAVGLGTWLRAWPGASPGTWPGASPGAWPGAVSRRRSPRPRSRS